MPDPPADGTFMIIRLIIHGRLFDIFTGLFGKSSFLP
jgi:hypothetical protein